MPLSPSHHQRPTHLSQHSKPKQGSDAHSISIPVITIDGPTASGKSTIGKLLAKKLGWRFLNSGILYRALAFAAMQRDISSNNSPALAELARNLSVEITDIQGQNINNTGAIPNANEILQPKHEGYINITVLTSQQSLSQRIIYQKRDITAAIRQEECSAYASEIAVLPDVRSRLSLFCQKFRQAPGLVTDGRDMGSNVFPDAVLKIFLSANPTARAKRRYEQLQRSGISASLRGILAGLDERDERDSTRVIAPLKLTFDTELIDTTNLGIEEVLQVLFESARQRLNL